MKSFKETIDSSTKIFCVIGHPISHSMSPIMHNAAIQELDLNFIYLAFDIKPENLKEAMIALKALDIKGINVTLPYKEKIIPYLDKVDPPATYIGAVNTIKNENGILIGQNTDGIGAKMALKDAGFDLHRKSVILIGAGGAAKAISYSLLDEIGKLLILNRTKDSAINLAKSLQKKAKVPIIGKELTESVLKEEIGDTDLLVNTTPVGMFPETKNTPIPINLLKSKFFVFDIIYHPLETELIKNAKRIGCKTLGGLEMLINQGALAFEWWTNKKPNINLMKGKIIERLKK